jgi:DNA replicative helicase MCM subunit Mcm2 (Cdc46/Mcm family)
VPRRESYAEAELTLDYVGLRGSFGQQHCNPRTLRSHQIGKMVSLEGIVTRCTFA